MFSLQLAAEQTQKFHNNLPTSEDLQKHNDKSFINNNECSTEKDTGHLKIENPSKTSYIQGSLNVEPHNDDDVPCCSGINQNPVSHLLTDTYDDDSFGDLCTQAFMMPKKSVLCEDTLGLLETQALIPSSGEDVPNINASIFDDMPTQAFPINVESFDDSKAIEERAVSELSPTPVIVNSSTSDQDSASTFVPGDAENQSSADLISGLNNAACEKPKTNPVICEGDYVSDSTSAQNTDSVSSIQFIGKSDDEVKIDNRATRDKATETLSDKQDAHAYDSHSDDDDTLPFVAQTEENLTKVKSGFSRNFSSGGTSIFKQSCIDDNDDTQLLQRKAPDPTETTPRDDAPCLPRTGDVVVPLEEYFSDIQPNSASVNVNLDSDCAQSNTVESGAVQTENFEELSIHNHSKLSATSKLTAGQSVKRHSTTICHDQDPKITDQSKAPAEQVSDHGPEMENEISDDDDATQKYDVTSIDQTPITDASKLQNDVANVIVENRPDVDCNAQERIETLQNNDNVATQVYDLTSVEETCIAVIDASAQQGIAATPFDKNSLSGNQKEVANVMEVSENQQTSDFEENDATTQEYDINTIEEPTTTNVTHDIKEPELVGNTICHDTKPQNNLESDMLHNAADIHNLNDQTRNFVPSLEDLENTTSAEMKPSHANKQQDSAILKDENANIVKAVVTSAVEMRGSAKVQPAANSLNLDATQPYDTADTSINNNQPVIASAVGSVKCQIQEFKACVESSDTLINDVDISITNNEFADDCAATQAYIKPAPVKTTPVVATCSLAVDKTKESNNSNSSKYSLRRKDFPLSGANVSKVPKCHTAKSKMPEDQVNAASSSSIIKSHNSNTKRYSLRKKNNSTVTEDTLDGLDSMQTQSFIKISEQKTSTTVPIVSANVDKCNASKYSLNKKSSLPSSGSNFDVSDIMETQQFIKQPDPQAAPTLHPAKPDTHKDGFSNSPLQRDMLPSAIGNLDVSSIMETQSFIKQPQAQISQSPLAKITPKENTIQISPSISQHDIMESSLIRTRSRRSARKDYAKLANGEPLVVGRKSSRASKGGSEKTSPKKRSGRVQKKLPLQGNNSSVQSTGGATTSTRSTRSKASADLASQTKQNKHTNASTNLVSSETNIEVIENAANKKSTDKLQHTERKKSSAINKKAVDVNSGNNSDIPQNTIINKAKETKTFPKRSLRSVPSEDVAQEINSNSAKLKDVNNDVYDFESSVESTIDLVKGSPSADNEEDENESVPSTSTGRRRASKRGVTKPDPTSSPSKSTGEKKVATTRDASKTTDLPVNRMDGQRKRRKVFPNPSTGEFSYIDCLHRCHF